VRARDRAGRVLAIPNQQPGVESNYGLSRADLDHEAWTIEPNGRKHGGAAAINRVLDVLGRPWRIVAALYRVPVVKQLEDIGYRWFATHRSWFARWGVRPECDEPGANCV
jgi:predicted DCC family thiol-disulfide oxidoreductase YuxK